jgi:hypothetical protein
VTENCVEISSLVRQAVKDTLKTSAPGISEQMRQAIANSVAMRIDHALLPQPFEPKPLEPLLPGETRSEYLDRLERDAANQQSGET